MIHLDSHKFWQYVGLSLYVISNHVCPEISQQIIQKAMHYVGFIQKGVDIV